MTQSFNLAQLANNLNTSGQLDATDGLYGVLPVANGGTGQSTLTTNNVLLGNGTSAVQAVAPSTSGNLLTSNGSTWVSQTPSLPSKLSTATGNPPSYSIRTWVLFDGINLTVTAGGNASSVSSYGSGRYIFNFATAFPDAYYACAGTASKNDGNDDGNVTVQVGGYNQGANNGNETGRCFVVVKVPTSSNFNHNNVQVMIVR